jgi:hypothetical protein
MKINKVLIAAVIFLMIFVNGNSLKAEADIHDYAGERILYRISPFGKAEYNDLGLVVLNGVKVNLVTFRTNILFVEDAQKIYRDPESSLPYRTERTISKFLGKEYVTQEYDQKKFTVVIRKFKGKKLVSEQIIKANGPIQDAILLPFFLSRRPNLEIGWNLAVRIPAEFKVELVSVDEITVPAGKFQAYHFESIPKDFEIWVNRDTPLVPLKMKGKSKGIPDYALLMKKYSLHNN